MQAVKPGRVRHLILLMLFLVTTVTFADRSTLSIAGSALQADLGIDALTLGYIFSAFGWAYVLGQVPGGWLFDRFGAKRVYAVTLFAWALFTLLQSVAGLLPVAWAVVSLLALRLLVGFAGAPCFPGNARVIAAWFPTRERATAMAMANSAQYFATALFAPLMGWVVQSLGWQAVFVVLGGLGLLLGVLWLKTIHGPREHPLIRRAELEHIAAGGGLLELGAPAGGRAGPGWRDMRRLLSHRNMLGLYFGQYCTNATTYFFLTWFPVYLVQVRGMSLLQAGFATALPALCGFAGGVLGGLLSDALLRLGYSLTLARKLPIVCGLLLSASLALCIWAESDAVVVGLMALAFFGKGLGSHGWTLVADISPRRCLGLSGGLFNTFGNLPAITTPIVVGYLVGRSGSYDGALLYVAANALLAVFVYLVIVGRIERIELDDEPGDPGQAPTATPAAPAAS